MVLCAELTSPVERAWIKVPSPIRKRKPSAQMQLAKKPTSEADVETILLFMHEHETSFSNACRQLQFNINIATEIREASPKLKALDAAVRSHYIREKVRGMNMIATIEEDVQRARLKCDNIKWEASRIMRQEFGDHVTVSGDTNAPLVVQHVHNAEQLINKIRGRTLEHDADTKD